MLLTFGPHPPYPFSLVPTLLPLPASSLHAQPLKLPLPASVPSRQRLNRRVGPGEMCAEGGRGDAGWEPDPGARQRESSFLSEKLYGQDLLPCLLAARRTSPDEPARQPMQQPQPQSQILAGGGRARG